MKKWVILLLGIIFSIFNNAYAQTVDYSYKPLSAEGCSMKYSVTKQNDKYYIIATVSSDRMKFLKESTMMVRNTKGDVLKLIGEQIDTENETAGIASGNLVIPITVIKSTAKFEITPEQFELIKEGIIKVRLSTIPIEHEREFKKDKIGRKLYEFYTIVKNKDSLF